MRCTLPPTTPGGGNPLCTSDSRPVADVPLSSSASAARHSAFATRSSGRSPGKPAQPVEQSQPGNRIERKCPSPPQANYKCLSIARGHVYAPRRWCSCVRLSESSASADATASGSLLAGSGYTTVMACAQPVRETTGGCCDIGSICRPQCLGSEPPQRKLSTDTVAPAQSYGSHVQRTAAYQAAGSAARAAEAAQLPRHRSCGQHQGRF